MDSEVVRCVRCGRVLCARRDGVLHVRHHRRHILICGAAVFVCEKCRKVQKVCVDGTVEESDVRLSA